MSEPDRDRYVSPFVSRWCGPEMLANFSDRRKFTLWRRLWIALAEAEAELGLPITPEQIAQMRENLEDVPFERAAELEKALRHDVMAHVHAFAEQCPEARPIIHLGATSCFVADNGDLVQIRDALRLLLKPLAATVRGLADFAETHAGLPCLAFTHFQPAQVTTVGKRSCLWIQDFLADLRRIRDLADSLPFRGVKGTTGTQASFLLLFEGDHEKVKALDAAVARRMGFERTFPVTGQTYPRKIDFDVVAALAGLAQSASKMAADIRLLSGKKEIDEPFGSRQIGSSAMPYKRNPMRCERVTSLARFIISLLTSPAFTAADQWLERTLDDSANRRLVLAESFLAAEAILRLTANVASGLVVYPAVIRRNLAEELPFMASEALLMEAVKAGGDRQTLHEKIRDHAVAAAAVVKQEGRPNDLVERLRADPAFASIRDRFDAIITPDRFCGRAPEQVREFLAGEVRPALEPYPPDTGTTELKV
jgi:adenylosuccinate lyase